MRKVLINLMLAALVLTLSEVVAADDRDQSSPQRQTRQVADPAAGGATASEREWEYLTHLQKCEPLADAEKTKCIDAARKKYGEM